jgi:hypothetical protein
MRSFSLTTLMTLSLLVGGCAVGVGYRGTVANDGYGPELVYAAPGVQVIADFDEPVFYVDNFYWRFYGGGWYRSPYYTGGWVTARPPGAVLRIDRPQAFVHYRPQGWVSRRERGASQPIARDQRPGRPAPQAYQAPPPRAAPPAVRGERPRFEPRPAEPARRPPAYQPQAPQAPRGVPQPPRGAPQRDRGRGDERGEHDRH